MVAPSRRSLRHTDVGRTGCGSPAAGHIEGKVDTVTADGRADVAPPDRVGLPHGGSQADASVAGIVILLIEDDPGDAVLVREYLADSDLDARLTHVSTLAQAGNVGYEPECILLDLHLPDGRGLD